MANAMFILIECLEECNCSPKKRQPTLAMKSTGTEVYDRPLELDIFQASPVIRRFKALIGEMRPDKISRAIRSFPEVRLSRNRSDSRYVISPNSIPPNVVANMSLMEGGSFSMKNSHIKLPAAAYGADSQKFIPLLRAALK